MYSRIQKNLGGQDNYMEQKGLGGQDNYMELEFDSETTLETPTSSNEGDSHISDPLIDVQPTELPQPTVRRSSRNRHLPDYVASQIHLAEGQVQEPNTMEEAQHSPDKSHWFKAMRKEMQSLKENEVWELVGLPEGRKLVGSKWVFKLKTDEDGKIERYNNISSANAAGFIS